MIENGIIYTVEVIKYYIVMKYLLGYKVRRNVSFSVLGAIVIAAFTVYVTTTENNPMLMFLLYIYIEMFMLIKEKFSSVLLSTLWLMIMVGMLDGMFLVLLEFACYKTNIEYSILDCSASVITMIFLIVVVWIVNKQTKGERVRISKKYLLVLSLITFAETIMVSVMETLLKEEYGNRILVLVFLCTIMVLVNIVILMFLAVSNDGYKQRDELNKRYLKMQEENYMYLMQKNEDTRRFRHDVKGHMFTLKQLINQGKIEQLDIYINRVEEELHLEQRRVSVTNAIVDAILNKYLYEAENKGIEFNVKGELFEDCKMEAYDLCTVFDNLLNNAVNAAGESVDKKIWLKIQREDTGIQIYVENSCMGDRVKEGNNFVTTKEDKENHGYGLKNVRSSVMKYNGTMTAKWQEDDVFCVDIFVPIV